MRGRSSYPAGAGDRTELRREAGFPKSRNMKSMKGTKGHEAVRRHRRFRSADRNACGRGKQQLMEKAPGFGDRCDDLEPGSLSQFTCCSVCPFFMSFVPFMLFMFPAFRNHPSIGIVSESQEPRGSARGVRQI